MCVLLVLLFKTCFFRLFQLDPLTAIKRSVRKFQDTTEVAFYDVKTVKTDLSAFKKDYFQFKEEIRTAIAAIAIKGPEAADFFPANDNSTIQKFLVRDSEFPKRKESLYFLLYGCATDAPKTFSDALISTVFTREYTETHVWPLGRYNN